MKTVLLVEGDKHIAKALRLRLLAQGFKVAVVHDAATAPMVARRCKPDVVLLDISMLGGDGFDAAGRLQGIFGDIPIIFLTASARSDFRKRAKEMGAIGFVLEIVRSGRTDGCGCCSSLNSIAGSISKEVNVERCKNDNQGLRDRAVKLGAMFSENPFDSYNLIGVANASCL